MGLDDRDYMHQRRDAVTPWERSLRPRQPAYGWVLPLTVWLAVLVAGYAIAERWLERREQQRVQRQPARAIVAPSARPPVVAPAAPPATPTTQTAPTYRTEQFTKCVSSDGRAGYSDGPCPPGSRATTVNVQPDVNLADGMSPEARAASLRNNSALAIEQQQLAERQVARSAGNSASECGQLNALITSIDAAARQPLSGFEQDRLSAEKRRARDRQFALRCQ